MLKSVPLAMPSATVWLSRSMVELTLRKNSCFASTGQSSASASIRLADAANEDISSATGAYFSAFFIAARSTDAVETIVRLETIFVFASSTSSTPSSVTVPVLVILPVSSIVKVVSYATV